MAGKIRPFAIDDVPAVADMFMRVFRKNASPSSASLRAYFIQLYFDNPRASPDHPSFVYCDASNSVKGFVGAVSVPMKVGERRITASVAGNNMVDPDLKDPFAGVLLLRKLFASNPVLTISDSANEISRALWTGLGGKVLTLYSMRWIRVFRPCGYLLTLIPNGSLLGRLKPLFKTACAVADIAGSKFFKLPAHLSQRHNEDKELDAADIITAFPDIVGQRTLLPDYSTDRLKNLISLAAEKQQFGSLVRRAVNDPSGKMAGWYMYYASKGNVAQVLQFAARPGMAGIVLGHLFLDARRKGCAAVIGGIEPALVKELSESQCLFFIRNTYTVAYSKDQQIMDALMKGDAFFSRLEGEFWTRLQGDQF